jgi:DNA topoisomerase-1
MDLILVESPNKARKIQGFLGRGVTVKASFGHICDLPAKEYGVDLATLEESYEVRNPKVVRELRAAIKSGGYDRVLLASDPDREGEAIAWHLARELKLKLRDANRIEFREITKRALDAALARPRPVDQRRVDAQRSRRVLDRIVGFDASKEICWPAGANSAGRCQTPALHLLCERERAILAFVPRTYFTLEASYAEGLTAFVPAEASAEKPGAASREPSAEEPRGDGSRLVPRQFASREEAEEVERTARAHSHIVRSVERARTERRPGPPYTTSTLQQDASRKLRLSAKQTMDQAQALFDAGYITYHRTDSTRVGDEAVEMARAYIGQHAPDALPKSPPQSRGKAGAQDAHEAIRPTHLESDGDPPPGTAKLYAMIKARILASQSTPAVFDRTPLWIDSGPVTWVSQGSVLVEPGFLTFWGPYARQEDVELPAVRERQLLTLQNIEVKEQETKPPARYDQGALIKKLESSGIGRPATFASIIDTLLKRDYVREITAGRGKSVLQPTELGMQLDGLMTAVFPPLVTEEYTAAMEAKLDEIERGEATRAEYLSRWYRDFREAMGRAASLGTSYRATHGLSARRSLRSEKAGRAGNTASSAQETTMRCDRCAEGTYRRIARKKGKGSFLACPVCRMTRDVRAQVKPNACPKCGSTLIGKKIKGRQPFFGCVRYGAATNPCSYSEPIAQPGANATAAGPSRARATKSRKRAASESSAAQKPDSAPLSTLAARYKRYTSAATDKRCPKCSARNLLLVTPNEAAAGVAMFACDDRGCGFTLPVGARRRKEPCPSCGGVVIERRQRPTATQSARGAGGDPYWCCARYPDCAFTSSMSSR